MALNHSNAVENHLENHSVQTGINSVKFSWDCHGIYEQMTRFPVHSESTHAGLVVLEPSSEYTNMPELPFKYLLISPAHFKLPGIDVINPVSTLPIDLGLLARVYWGYIVIYITDTYFSTSGSSLVG